MENHPIPQDVTGFKFKLIGTITVKQFGYLLLCSIFAYFFFALPGPMLLRYPFVALFALIGIGLAFVPIDGRPMDIMLWYLLKAIPADNQYIYRKTHPNFPLARILSTPLYPHKKDSPEEKGGNMQIGRTIRRTAPPALPRAKTPTFELEAQEVGFMDNIKRMFDANPDSSQSIQQQSLKIQSAGEVANPNPNRPLSFPGNITLSHAQTKKPTNKQEMTLPSIKKETKKDFFEDKKIQQAPLAAPLTTQQRTIVDEDIMQGKFLELAKQQATGQQQPSQSSQKATSLSQDSRITAGFPLLPDIPNIILGIIKDPRGKILPNILVEIFDKNNIPVRAFKTNRLGQFAAATQLPNGVYIIRFEDPTKRNEFGTINVTLDGSIFQPIEIVSTDDREKLRKELFENN